MKKIALFGGSFDPPHLGHVAVVERALEQLDIEKLVIIPTYLNPFKSRSHAPAVLRLKWLRRVFSDYSKVQISDLEVRQGRPVTTLESVKHFSKDGRRIYVIIGADNLGSLHRWHRFHELDRLVTWVVATRDDIDIPSGYIVLDVSWPISSTQLRERPGHHALPPAVAREIAKFYKEDNARTNREDQSYPGHQQS